MNPKKILIVEDELIAAESLALDLKKLGYEVVGVVTSGEKAIAKTSEVQPNLILMDVMLKGNMDGISAAQTIHERFDIPIIYLTAYADVNTLERAKSTCAYGYLVKPYKLQDVSSTLAVALAKYQEDVKIKENLVRQRKLNQLKTQALAAASHDLRTPLTNILGYTELLRDYGEIISQEKKHKYFEYIKSAVGEMNDSLEDLLLISRAEEGKIKLSREEFDLVAFFRHIVEEYSLVTQQHELEFLCPEASYQAFLDRNILRHILDNLLSNALKYSPEGGKIIVGLSFEEEQISFYVRDEGIGIPDDYKEKLFHLFERATNVGSIKGNGLGLSLVKKAVELQQGTIIVESKEGVGSKFIVTIPQRKDKKYD
jgi:signal transduction histidine kinase